MTVRTQEETAALREGGRILAQILREVVSHVQPGVTTKSLDEVAERHIRKEGGEPAFKGYKAFGARSSYPGTVCTSVNDEVVHGIPGSRVLAEGDIIGIDIGMKWPFDSAQGKPAGLFTDMAVTVPVGKVSREAQRLIDVTKTSLDRAIAAVHAGAHVGDIGAAVERCVDREGFGIVRDLVGHGTGRELHEEPEVPNFGKHGTGPALKEGMVIAIEPMVTAGDWHLQIDKDDWTWRTRDGSLAAHFEHTILVTKNGAEVLTR